MTRERMKPMSEAPRAESWPVLYFGPYDRVGHYLHGLEGQKLNLAVMPPRFRAHIEDWAWASVERRIDGCFCPGGEKTSRRETEGEARLTHENGLTILGVWDRSVDKRPGSHSTYLALGTHDFATMRRLCEETYPERWRKLADRVEIKLVEETKR